MLLSSQIYQFGVSTNPLVRSANVKVGKHWLIIGDGDVQWTRLAAVPVAHHHIPPSSFHEACSLPLSSYVSLLIGCLLIYAVSYT